MIAPAEFFSPDFAIPALVRGRQISVIFDEQYIDASGVESSQPAATCSSADIDGVEQDDQIEIKNEQFRIIGVQPDGTGVTVLRLARA